MEEFSEEEMEQLYSVFRDQTMQILDDFGQDLLALESRGIDEETLGRLRRGAHTIKGDASCVGLEGVTEIAHRVEDVLGWVVEGNLEYESDIVDWLLSCLDSIREAISGDDIRDVRQDEIAALAGRFDSPNRRTMEEQIEVSDSLAVPNFEKKKAEAPVTNAVRRDYVRVEASRIDTLLNLASEMVIARSHLNGVVPELEEALPKNDAVERLNGTGLQLGKLISELQKSVLKMRMVAIGTVFKRFSRPMRELAAERGKQAELMTEGDETELDRTLVDAMYEPLLHLLRNSVDHGLETAEQRAAKGKPLSGRIKLAAYHEGNQVVVEVSDDGCGIDTRALKAKAIEAGAISEKDAESLTEEEAFELIFLQGVSTAREVTRVSGRGIGMAAVRAAIEQMRGTISIRSGQGEGTCFVIRMPLTLAIIRGLLFMASGQLFALPLLAVSEIVRAGPEEMTFIDEYESLRHRDTFISLIRPGVVLGFERRQGGAGARLRREAGQSFVIVLNAGSGRYGLIADGLLGEQELVIKPLEERWIQNDALAGASVLGDGRVALIMDGGAMIRKVVKYERKRVEARGGYGLRD